MIIVALGAVVVMVVLLLRRRGHRRSAAKDEATAGAVVSVLGVPEAGWARDPFTGRRDRGGF